MVGLTGTDAARDPPLPCPSGRGRGTRTPEAPRARPPGSQAVGVAADGFTRAPAVRSPVFAPVGAWT